MPVIILYLVDCHNYHIYPAVGCGIVGRGNLITSAGTQFGDPVTTLSCHMFTALLPVASVFVSACL